MKVSEILTNQEHTIFGKNQDSHISNIQYDSRKIQKGDMFFCIKGLVYNGHDFAQEAIQNGAIAIVVSQKLELANINNVMQILVEDTRIAMAQMSAKFFGYPAQKLKMIGITGTNGKTTTTYMLKSIADGAGLKTGMIGTINNIIDNKVVQTERTTPESLDLQRLLAQMADENVEMCFMEVSSHALEQGRTHGIVFDIAIFTNLSQDHLDYHKTMQNYTKAKKKLFEQSRFAIINSDDLVGNEIIKEINYSLLTYGISKKSDFNAKDIDITSDGVHFNINWSQNEMSKIELSIPGLFSVFNALAAASAAFALGFSPQQIQQGLKKLINVPGRLERILPENKKLDFTVLLDFAHSPDGMENILKTVKSFAKGRIVTLFGCGGNRDRAKRPIMGEIAGRYSDFCVVTTDNPRDEKPGDIICEIIEGTKKSGCEYIVIEDRKKAFLYCIENAKKDDVIILAGRGHEKHQEIMGVMHKFSDKKTMLEILENKY